MGKTLSYWGKDGRRGGILLLLLVGADSLGPAWLLRENLGRSLCYWPNWFLIMGLLIVGGIVYKLTEALFATERRMMTNLRDWMRTKEYVDKHPDLRDAIERILDEVSQPKHM